MTNTAKINRKGNRALWAALAVLAIALSSCGSDWVAEASERGDVAGAAVENTSTTETTDEPATTANSAEPETTTTTTAPPSRARLVGDVLAPVDARSAWSGTIGEGENPRQFRLWLTEQDGFLLGQITYVDTELTHAVAGKRLADGFFLHEFGEGAEVTDTFTASSVLDGEVVGLTAVDSPATFTLEEIIEGGHTVFAEGLEADTYGYEFAPFETDDPCCGPAGTLTLSDLTEGSATLAIDANTSGPGFNLASIEPSTVAVTDSTARYELLDENYDCAFDIVGFTDVIFVDYVDERFDCGFGFNASVQGVYIRVGE